MAPPTRLIRCSSCPAARRDPDSVTETIKKVGCPQATWDRGSASLEGHRALPNRYGRPGHLRPCRRGRLCGPGTAGRAGASAAPPPGGPSRHEAGGCHRRPGVAEAGAGPVRAAPGAACPARGAADAQRGAAAPDLGRRPRHRCSRTPTPSAGWSPRPTAAPKPTASPRCGSGTLRTWWPMPRAWPARTPRPPRPRGPPCWPMPTPTGPGWPRASKGQVQRQRRGGRGADACRGAHGAGRRLRGPGLPAGLPDRAGGL